MSRVKWPSFPGMPRLPSVLPPSPPKGMGKRRAHGGNITRKPIKSYGPKYLKKYALALMASDWCVPWPNFVGAHTSLSEQMIFRAIARVTGDPPNPEKPPYVGGVNWTYQDPLQGGRLTIGGQVCDFLVVLPNGDEVCIRLQSERYHVFAEIAKRMDELFEKAHPTAHVIDIYEEDFVADCSGEAACRVVADALALREPGDPGYRGTTQPTRRRGGDR
jgi:hypothetical protein